MVDRARGAMLGLAVGDALGTTYEFAELTQAAYPTLMTGPATDVVGGGPFGLVAGQITDDTQMAVCLARSLGDCGGLDLEEVGGRYVAWMREAFDVGNQTRTALTRIAKGESAKTAGLSTWRASGYNAAGNGSLMRTVPLVLEILDPTALIEAAIAESMITHADPRCSLACAAFDAAAAAAIDRGIAGTEMVKVAHGALAFGAKRLITIWKAAGASEDELARVTAARVDLEADLAAALASEPGVDRAEHHIHRTAGFVRVAFRIAFWHAVHTPSWRAAVVDVASRGGDADTNAAIVGALLGARDGAEAIPAAWVERVLGATQRGSAAWADAHHPKHLLDSCDEE